ncbi:MAG: outer membrane lipoprotein carrier protein LolA [Candidatus Sulfotelmatobacter sp.]
MRNFLLTIGVLWLMLVSSFGAAQKEDASSLDNVLKRMDETAAHFQTAQADFVFDQYQKVVDETDTQKGTVYYRKAGQQIEMMAEFTDPDKKFVLYKDGKLQVYQPKIEQVMEYSAGANQQELESLMVLGFGGSGQELKKSYDVTYQGEESIDGTPTAKLQLIPKNDKLRSNIPQMILWIDLTSGISVQQQFVQTQGDYRLAKYSAIKVNAKINNDVFHLKTTGKTKFVSPRG